MKQRLLSESNLTFEKAVQMTSQFEMAEKSAASLSAGSSDGHGGRIQRMAAASASASPRPSGQQPHPRGSAHHNTGRGRQQQQPTSSAAASASTSNDRVQWQCFCCGDFGHIGRNCRFKGSTCHKCGKKNHLAKVCRSQQNSKSQFQFRSNKSDFRYNRNKQHNYVDEVSDDVSVNDDIEESIGNLFGISEGSSKITKVDPFKTEVILENKSVTFEVDTGASVTVVSEAYYKDNLSTLKLFPTDIRLSSYTNVPIYPVGKLEVNVQFRDKSRTLDLYVIKDGAHPLMGRDWIKELGVDISFKNNEELFVATSSCESKSKHESLVKELVKEFPEVFSDQLGQCNCKPVRLVVKENAIAKYHRPRSLPYTLKAKVEKELERLVESDILVPVCSSEYGSPIVPVPKKDGSIRICGDFRHVNAQLEIDRYPIPRVEDLFTELQKGEFFSKIDLSQAYMQLRLDESSQKLCTISTHKGLFAYKRLPYGIASAVGIFQRVIEQALQGLQGVKCFLDDIIVSGPNDEVHLSRLREVCSRLKAVGFTVKQDKCKFFASKFEFLGFTIDKHGLHTSQAKIKAIVDAPVPRNVTEVKSFVGLVNYYSKFVPNIAGVLRRLYDLLKKDVEFCFGDECMKSFKKVKELLCTAPVLAHYDPQAPVILTVDASNYGLGCILSIIDKDGTEKPVSFASRTLNQAEQNYSQIDKEALAVVYGVKKFHQYLYGKHFTLKSDHKPLISIFGPKKGLPVFAASRLQRYALFLSGYDFDIKYVRSDNNSADALSRLPLKVSPADEEPELLWLGTYLHFVKESSVPVTCDQIRVETQKDPLLRRVLGYVMFGWPNFVPKEEFELFPFYQRREELAVEQGVLMWGYKVIVPSSLRSYVLNELHASHLGITKMKSVARSYFWYPSLDKDIENLANSCSSCLLERPNPSKAELHHWHYPSRPWARLHVDHLGPFKGKLYLIVVDAHSKWLEVFETSSTSANHTINHLRDLFARFGLPESIHSDNGPPHTTSAPYHAQSNGQAENSVKYAKSKLKCAFRENVNTSVALSRILFDYRNSVHMTTNETPAMLMFNRPLRTRLDLLRPNLSETVNRQQQAQKMYARGSKTQYLFENQNVLIRDYTSKDKWIEGCVVRQISPTMYIVKLSSGVTWKRHIDQLIAIDSGPVLTSDADNRPTATTVIARPAVQSTPAERDVSPMTRELPGHSTRLSLSPTTPRRSMVPQTADRNSPPAVHRTPVQHRTSTTPQRRYPMRARKPVERIDL
ncbi:uncharacterized protein K02A2.6-like [Macrosteles quadrilineatus]|uniref:uncharacterized protein K02A2.6-like n=1 Tax=Macrosteles quadrilineatus TaxID=74068 RepID=UPI0023E11E82|nr:uncharacterized protein K02A2.6-like [Macrosteles quadrilineatus]